jgi:hypothetical protein
MELLEVEAEEDPPQEQLLMGQLLLVQVAL